MTTFIPLHANPAVFTEMIRHLGVKDEIVFEDLPTFVDADTSPRPVLAVVAWYLPGDEEGVVDIVQYPFAEECACDDGQSYGPYDEGDCDCDTDYDPVVSFRQYIPTACSMYAAVHAVLNSCPSRVFKPGLGLRTVSGFFCTPNGRCRTIRPEVAQEAYAAALAKDLADCPLPEGAYSDDPSAYEAPHHFVCFARSDKDGCLYVLNGSNNGPIATKLGPVDAGEGGDMLGADTMALIRSHIARVSFWGDEEDFCLLGLVDRGGGTGDGNGSATGKLASEEKCY